MGQRHQLFVIAKIKARYRTLAVVHHQWLLGYTAVRQCRNVLRILHAESNRHRLRQDLQKAQSYDFDSLSPPKNTRGVFPFITTSLVLGASLDAESGHHSSVHVLNIATRYDQVDNNDGISIFDITELGKERYAFCFLEDVEDPLNFLDSEDDLSIPERDEGRSQPEKHQIIDAETYLAVYCARGQGNVEDFLYLAAACDAFPLVRAEALESLWPGAGWTNMVHEDGELDGSSGSNHLSTLQEESLSKVIDKALSCAPDDLSWVTQAE